MKKVLWIVRIIFGMSCAVATLGGVIMSVQDPVPENILLTVDVYKRQPTYADPVQMCDGIEYVIAVSYTHLYQLF